jgi:hypothetical protein
MTPAVRADDLSSAQPVVKAGIRWRRVALITVVAVVGMVLAFGAVLSFFYHPKDTTPSAVGDCVKAEGFTPAQVFATGVKATKVSCSDPGANYTVEKRISGTDGFGTEASLELCPAGDIQLAVQSIGGSSSDSSWTLCLAPKI